VITITITGERTGKMALLYEHPGRKGRRKFVPTYVATAKSYFINQQFEFAVTRDSSAVVFSETPIDRFGLDGECPPCNGTSYIGIVREDGAVGFRIEFFEPKYWESATVRGQGNVMRRCLQIHFGAAASHGCILVAGRRRSYPQTFERPLREMMVREPIVRIQVQPRA
jgi:hypothetical protein